jgi:alpha-galactosidase
MGMVMKHSFILLILLIVGLFCVPEDIADLSFAPFVQEAAHSDNPYTRFTVGVAPEHEVCYVSGKTVYVEGLIGDQWAGRYWAADGRINFPPGMYNFSFQKGVDSAFEISIKDDPIPRTASGTVLSKGWKWISASERPTSEPGTRHVLVELSNTLYPITVKLHTVLDGTPVLTRWLEITNVSAKPLALTALSPWSGRLWTRTDNFDLGYQLTGKGTETTWITGGRVEWKRLGSGSTVIQSLQGNGYDDPFFIVREDDKGEYFISHLAWSANYRIEFDCAQDRSNSRPGLTFKMGPSATDALRVIAPEETVLTPKVHLGHLAGDLDATVQAMHDHIRRSVLPKRKFERSYRVQYAVPGDQGYYTGEAFNETNVLKAIDVAVTVGAELFILDAGWWDTYGEWTPSPQRFPHGLKPIVDYVHQKGLLFGLYFEVEGGRGNWCESNVFKQHPDWFTQQDILRLDKPEVAAYLESVLTGLIERYHPDLYRHDFIPVPLYTFEGPSALHEGFMENAYWRYYEAYYAIWERIHAKFPDLILQMCSNGGAREDLDMMSHFQETYTNEAEVSQALPPYSGKTLALPPEILVIGLGTTTDKGDLNTLLRATFTLSPPWILYGAAPSVETLNPERRERFLHYANLYKGFIRPLLPTCQVYHHAPVSAHGGVTSSPWFAMEYGNPTRTKAWATVVRLAQSKSDFYLFKPRGLDPARVYRVTLDSTGTTSSAEGWRLVNDGISIRLESVMSSELILFEAAQ